MQPGARRLLLWAAAALALALPALAQVQNTTAPPQQPPAASSDQYYRPRRRRPGAVDATAAECRGPRRNRYDRSV